MSELFYKLLSNGLIVCGGFVSLIISIVVWRKMWVGDKTFAELGSEGNVLIFMSVLAVVCFFMAWRMKIALKQLK